MKRGPVRRACATVCILFVATICASSFLHAVDGDAAPGRDWLRRAIETAQPGATIQVPSGVHAGPFVIGKTLQLHGATGAVLEGPGTGHVIEIHADDVELTGLVIRRSGSRLTSDDSGVYVHGSRARIHRNVIVDTLHGVYLRRASDCRITRNVIRGRAPVEAIADPLVSGLKLTDAELCSEETGQDRRGNGIHVWNSEGHLIAENDIRGTRDGIYFSFCHRTLVRDNAVGGVRYGLHYMYSNDNVFERNRFTESAAGSALMYSKNITLRRNTFFANRSHRAYGVLMHSVETTRVEENAIRGNTIGLFMENCLDNTVVGNELAANHIGLRLSDSSSGNRLSRNRLLANIHAVESSGRETGNIWSINGEGNYWEGALTLDLDRDRVADVPHHEGDVFGRWRRTFPEIGLLAGSPGERALRYIHARVRVPGLPGVKDDHPLVPVAGP